MPSQRRRSPSYLARRYKRRNEKLRRDYLIGRLMEWQENGRDPEMIPPIRAPLEGAIAIYANHGVTQKMYYTRHGRWIEEREVDHPVDEDEGRKVMNYDRIERARQAIKDSGVNPLDLSKLEEVEVKAPLAVLDFDAMEQGK